MSKYFDTKPGSLEEAVSAAQQAAIAISKKEKGEKPKNEDQGQFSFVAAQAKKNGDKQFTFAGKKYDTETEELVKEAYKPVKANHYDVKVTVSDKDVAKVKKIISNFKGDIEDVDSDQVDGGGNKFKGTGDIFIQGDDAGKLGMEIAKAVKTVKVMGETNKNDKSDDGDGLDAVQPKAVKKKFDDRKDKDIDNDGDVDSSDKFLHKRRKAVSKAMGEEISEEKFRMMIETLTELSPALLKRAADAAAKRASDDGKKATAADKRDSNVKKGMMPKAGSAADKADTKYRASKARADRIAKGAADASDREAEKEYQKQKKAKQNESVSLKDSILNMWKEAQDMEQDKNGDGIDDDGKAKKTAKKTDSGKDVTPVETSVKMPKLKNEKNKV